MTNPLIVIDVGNSLTKYSLFSNAEIQKTIQYPTSDTKTRNEYQKELALLPVKKVRTIIYGSVVPEVDKQLQQLLTDEYPEKLFVIKTDANAKLTQALEKPGELGSDLFGFASYLANEHQTNCGIIYGTAIVSLLVKQGVITKVAILPGVSLAFNALLKKAAKLSTWGQFITPAPQFGRATITALQAGRFHYYQGVTNQLITSWQKTETFHSIVLSGGDVPTFSTTTFKTIQVKNAVSLGYVQIFEQSKASKF